MKIVSVLLFTGILSGAFIGCGTQQAAKSGEMGAFKLALKPGVPIAVMPFETENALSNLGSHLSDEIIAELVERFPNLKIIPGTIVRNYLQTAGLAPSGLPDEHSIHHLKDSLRCRYLLTGNLYQSIGEVRYTQTNSTRIASGSVTVRLVDCDSMYVVWAKHIESTYSTTTFYYSGNGAIPTQSTYLTDGQLIQGLLRNLASDVAREFYVQE